MGDPIEPETRLWAPGRTIRPLRHRHRDRRRRAPTQGTGRIL